MFSSAGEMVSVYSVLASLVIILRLEVSRALQDKKRSVTIGRNQEIMDVFEGIQLRWRYKYTEHDKIRDAPSSSEERYTESFELSFHKKHMEKVLRSYLRHVESESKAIKKGKKL
ncbi:hypothetical protein HHK36_030079 [Tetracentron sinense]|uniref:AAA-type ATPase N-terminal domain-containing protein n=1 Tax=Tetracentron sinense TaxID=13715 RepID=A0A835D0B3_TETSI|nr:hypothetical protein HHK36_030079 [Tetracentron sinense]